MKKIITSISVFLFTNFLFGQAVLEHSYSTSSTEYESSFDVLRNGVYNAIFLNNNQLHYYTFNNGTNVIEVFNSSHESIKIITLSETPIKINYITDKLFNNDSLIEVLYATQDDIKIVNEEGNLIQTMNGKTYAKIFKVEDDIYKLCVSSSGEVSPGGSYYQLELDIYSLSGTLSSLQQQIYLRENNSSYPNPAHSKINIPNSLAVGKVSSLEVFDLNGRLILTKQIIGGESYINLDVSELVNGTYIYKLNNDSGKFIKK